MEFKTTSYGVAKVNKTTYADGNLAVALTDSNGSPLAKLSINLPDYAYLLGENQFFAKTYSENTEIAQDALASGLFRQFNTTVQNGWVECPVWEILNP
jgi:DNA-binding MurR/RpiR family transcriptional regulator